MEVSDDPVMVADGKLGSGFWHMNYQASYNPWNSKTRQAGVESAPRLRYTWRPAGLGVLLILTFPPVLQVLGAQSRGTQGPGYGLRWPHISV